MARLARADRRADASCSQRAWGVTAAAAAMSSGFFARRLRACSPSPSLVSAVTSARNKYRKISTVRERQPAVPLIALDGGTRSACRPDPAALCHEMVGGAVGQKNHEVNLAEPRRHHNALGPSAQSRR